MAGLDELTGITPSVEEDEDYTAPPEGDNSAKASAPRESGKAEKPGKASAPKGDEEPGSKKKYLVMAVGAAVLGLIGLKAYIMFAPHEEPAPVAAPVITMNGMNQNGQFNSAVQPAEAPVPVGVAPDSNVAPAPGVTGVGVPGAAPGLPAADPAAPAPAIAGVQAIPGVVTAAAAAPAPVAVPAAPVVAPPPAAPVVAAPVAAQAPVVAVTDPEPAAKPVAHKKPVAKKRLASRKPKAVKGESEYEDAKPVVKSDSEYEAHADLLGNEASTKDVAVSAEPPKPAWEVQAVIPGRAWLQGREGNVLSVAVGDNVPGMGRVTAINAEDGSVVIGKRKIQ